MNQSKNKIPFRALFLHFLFALLIAGCSSTNEEDTSVYSPETRVVEEVIVTGQRKSNEPESVSDRIRAQREYKHAQEKAKTARQSAVLNAEQQKLIEIEDNIISYPVDPTMTFKNYGVNPTVDSLDENTTTFSIDVDTASYNVAKGFLDRGILPDANGIRVEEFVNSFNYGYPSPDDELFGIHAEAFPSPYRRGFHVLHLGLKAKELDATELKTANITLLVDVSGSMAGGNRLGLLKDGLNMLVNTLSANDTISIVTYSDTAALLLEPTEIRHKHRIKQAIASLHTQQSTNIGAGIELAYRVANKSFDPERTNRIILCSDGVANVGNISADTMIMNVSKAAKKGIYLNAVGVGMGNYNDVTLEELATKGEGHYGYINTTADAKKMFVDNLNSNLQVVARDVRLQVQFDPLYVKSYRLIGYENRGMANKDFDNAKKDAGEVGTGHTVTAIYEVKFREQTPSGNFGMFRVNYKTLDSEQLTLTERHLSPTIVAASIKNASANTQLSYISAAFAEKLRASYWSRTYSYSDLLAWLAPITTDVTDHKAAKELRRYINTAASLDTREDRYSQLIPIQHMNFDHVPVLSN